MKALIKFAFTIALVGGITLTGYAQSQDIAATAEVRKDIQFTVNDGSVDFGIVPDVSTGSGDAPQVNTQGSATNTLGGTASNADFEISASNAQISVTYTTSTTLDDGTASYNVPFQTLVEYDAGNVTADGTPTECSGSFTVTPTSQTVSVFVGGVLDTSLDASCVANGTGYDVSAQTTPASLTAANGGGDLTFSVSYN